MILETLEQRDIPSVSQWANSVIGFSSQTAGPSFTAQQATSPPNVPTYGGSASAWSPSAMDGTTEYVELGFATPVHATEVRIRENSANGFVTQVEARDTNGALHILWTGTDTTATGSPADFVVSMSATSYLVQSIKVTITTDAHLGQYEQIDAIQLTGDRPPVAVDDVYSVPQDQTSVSGNALTNDSDPDGDSLTVVQVNGSTSLVGQTIQGQYGSFTLSANGQADYNLDLTKAAWTTLGDNETPTDHFTYLIADGMGGFASASQDFQAPAIRRIRAELAPIQYEQTARIWVRISGCTPSSRIVIKLDQLAGTTVASYYAAATGGNLLDEATDPMMSNAQGNLEVWIPASSLPSGVHTFRVGQRSPQGGILPGQPLSAETGIFRILPP